MRTIAHLSDLHFGRVDRSVLEPLRRRLFALAPHLVVVSGDVTQRARPDQFREARAFLETLPQPQLVVPGNHDVPLYNVFARFVRPLARYRRVIARDVEPAWMDEEVAVLGVNTARSLTFKNGRVSRRQVDRVRKLLCPVGRARTRILVAHHPSVAEKALEACDIDVLLTGHLHATKVACAVKGRCAALTVQAGTATSSRTREEPNAFNVLRIARGRIEVEQLALEGADFAPVRREAFERSAGGWRRSDA